MCRPYTLQKYFATFMANYLRLPLKGTIMEVLGNGMTGGMAFDEAVNAVALGHADVALALGINMESQANSAEHMMSTMRAIGDVDFHTIFGFTPISWYAMDAVRYMHEHGATRAELASVAVKDRRHAALNPIAQFKQAADAGGGAGRAAHRRAARTLRGAAARRWRGLPRRVRGGHGQGDGQALCLGARPRLLPRGRAPDQRGAQRHDGLRLGAGRRRGGLPGRRHRPADLDLAELYAPCTIVQVLAGEAMGLTPRGRGAAQAAAGETTLGGRIPICTSGGCLSRGHPAYITGLLTIYELWEQLTHRAGERQVRNARLGAGSCELGNYNAALIHILEAVA